MKWNAITMLTCATLCLMGCVKDSLWHEHYTKAYTAGEHITVSVDSIATVDIISTRAADEVSIEPMPGYLTIVTSRFYANDDGGYLLKQHDGLEAMHNVRTRVRVTQGDPTTISTLKCKLGGLASRFDIPRIQLMGPESEAITDVKMTDTEGSARFRILGAAAEKQPLILYLTTTDGGEYEVEVDVTKILSQLHPTPFEVDTETAVAIDQGIDVSEAIDAEVKVELELTVNIDIEIHLPDPLTGASFTAAIINWNEHVEDFDAY